MTTDEAKALVKAKFPDAVLCTRTHPRRGKQVYVATRSGVYTLSDIMPNNRLAWVNAAEQLKEKE